MMIQLKTQNQPVQKGEPQESHSDQSPQPKPSNTNNNIDLKDCGSIRRFTQGSY